MDDNHDGHAPSHSLPIPTYEEATNSRPSSRHTGPSEISDDAERQGLLGQQTPAAPRTHAAYHAPTVSSARSSLDSDLHLPEVTGDDDDGHREAALVRRDMEEMEMLDAEMEPIAGPLRKRLHYLTTSLSGFRLPRLMPSGWSLPQSWSLPQIPMGVVARLAGLATLALSAFLLIHYNLIPMRRRMGVRYDPESVRQHVMSVADKDRIADSLRYISSFDHVAGTEGDLFLAQWMYERWKGDRFDDVEMNTYHVYLNYPTPDGRKVAIPELGWEAALEEDNAFRFTGESRQQTLVFHGSSRAGNVTGHLVYANGGSREDFQQLADMGVEVEGSIALVKYYGSQGDRALKVKAAELAGAVGCLIYSDPQDDGFLQGPTIPDGQWRPEDSVQRGSVGLMSWVLGDYLTPGWASDEKAKRISEIDNPGLNNIPSLPLSARDAQKLLQSIHGKGQRVPPGWAGGVPEVEWWTGGADSPTVWLQNEQEENKQQTIWNVKGVIRGVESPEKHIIVGNHRDAWCFGAADPGSGTAVMMEVTRIFTDLLNVGWRPLRTIQFMSWDAEEYNMMGSTEFVEDYIDHLRMHGAAYLNVDTGVAGSSFRASASPLFGKMMERILERVQDPQANTSLKALWDEKGTKIEGLGSGSDYVAFQDLAGVSSIDFGFTGPPHSYPYHSCYETFEWMEKYGDPTFEYHRALAQIWALMILEVADSPMLPYDLVAYARAVESYVEQLEKDAAAIASEGHSLDLSSLTNAVNSLFTTAQAVDTFEAHWTQQVLAFGGLESNKMFSAREDYNQRLLRFEKDLLDLPGLQKGDEHEPHGIPGREQYKHVIFGPQLWSGYDAAYFPAVRDALEAGDWGLAQKQVEKAAKITLRAQQNLAKNLDF